MTHEQRIERKRKQVEEAARALGELVARETFDEGVGLDVDLFTIESLAVIAAKAVVRGVVETATADQAQSLGQEHACPGCGRSGRLDHRSRAARGARRDGKRRRTSGALPGMSPGFFSLCGRCSSLTATSTAPRCCTGFCRFAA